MPLNDPVIPYPVPPAPVPAVVPPVPRNINDPNFEPKIPGEDVNGPVHGGPAQPPVEWKPPETADRSCPGGHWNNNAKQCRPGPGPTAQSGGAGGWMAQAPQSIGTAPGADEFSDYDTKIKGWIDALMGGQFNPYNDPNYMGGLESSLFQAGQGRLRQSTDEIYRDSIRRGVGRGGIAAEGIAGANRTAQAEYSKGVRDLNIEKANKDLELKMKGLDAAQRWLDSRRQYLLQKESNSLQREIGLANIRLGYARLDSEKELLQMQLDARGGGGGGGQDYGDLLQIINSIVPPPPPPPQA